MPMIAEVCRFYHWTVDYCLEMPAIQFFAMLDQSRIMRAMDRLNDCDIAAIPACNEKYFTSIRKQHERVLQYYSNEIQKLPEEPKKPPVKAEESFDAMKTFFSLGKRVH